MGKRLDPAEKVARAAARIADSLGPEARERVTLINKNVKGVGGPHFIANGRLVALFEALDEWKASKS